jgi:hypothetical protein
MLGHSIYLLKVSIFMGRSQILTVLGSHVSLPTDLFLPREVGGDGINDQMWWAKQVTQRRYSFNFV